MKRFKEHLAEALAVEPGTQLGSNPGGIHVDDQGQKHYVKQYRNSDQAKVEVLTGKLYNRMGIKTVNPEYKGKGIVSTPFNDKLDRMHPKQFEKLNTEQKHQVGRMYHAAVLTKNWDIVGLEHDNILKHRDTGELHAIDHGGAFHFRAQGGPKEYGSDIDEHSSLRKPDRAAGHVFKHALTPEIEKASLSSVRNLDPAVTHNDFKESGLSNWQDLHKNFEARRSKLLAHYGE